VVAVRRSTLDLRLASAEHEQDHESATRQLDTLPLQPMLARFSQRTESTAHVLGIPASDRRSAPVQLLASVECRWSLDTDPGAEDIALDVRVLHTGVSGLSLGGARAPSWRSCRFDPAQGYRLHDEAGPMPRLALSTIVNGIRLAHAVWGQPDAWSRGSWRTASVAVRNARRASETLWEAHVSDLEDFSATRWAMPRSEHEGLPLRWDDSMIALECEVRSTVLFMQSITRVSMLLDRMSEDEHVAER
jgi:hypothetical protein